MLLRKLFYALIALSLVSCTASPYTYHITPTPLKKGASSYFLKNVAVNLTLGHGAIPGDTSFASQEDLTKQFTAQLKKNLISSGILAASSSSADAEVEVSISYTRTYNIGGKALNKPEVSHIVTILKGPETLASFRSSHYTTKYAYLEESIVDLQIATFQWGAEDELKDVAIVAEAIAKDIYNAGN